MKVITLLQPFASLVVLGQKNIDTRPNDTGHRGEILIHAGSTRLASSRFLYDNKFNRYLESATLRSNHGNDTHIRPADFDRLPFGAIIGKASLCATMPVGLLLRQCNKKFTVGDGDYKGMEFMLSEKELSLGDYSHDRTAYFFAGAEQFNEPIPVKGSQRLWDYMM